MDLSKLTPARWEVLRSRDVFSAVICPGVSSVCHDIENEADAEFIALARNAFDVLQRRKWAIVFLNYLGVWQICRVGSQKINRDSCRMDAFDFWQDTQKWPDPFTALVEADKWYKENVEKKS